MVALVAQHGVEYLFATVWLHGLGFQIFAGVMQWGKSLRRLCPHPRRMLGFVNGLADCLISLAQMASSKCGARVDYRARACRAAMAYRAARCILDAGRWFAATMRDFIWDYLPPPDQSFISPQPGGPRLQYRHHRILVIATGHWTCRGWGISGLYRRWTFPSSTWLWRRVLALYGTAFGPVQTFERLYIISALCDYSRERSALIESLLTLNLVAI